MNELAKSMREQAAKSRALVKALRADMDAYRRDLVKSKAKVPP